MILKPTNAHKCTKVYYTHCMPPFFYMFRPLMWPSSGRCIIKNTYIEILQKLMEPMHRYKILYLKNIWFKIYVKD
jgi:hypothetical protein